MAGPTRFSKALTVAALLGPLLAGCAAPRSGRPWGEDATLFPSSTRLWTAAVHAVTAHRTWAPAAGAALFGVTGWDRGLASWGARRTPVFGSQTSAAGASDRLNDAALLLMYGTALAAPSGEPLGTATVNKARGIGLETLAVLGTGATTGAAKITFRRERPDGSDRKSFPSGHASQAAVRTSLAGRNLASWSLPAPTARALDGGLLVLTASTAWARIEAEKHFPSDVLAGIALGNFLGTFFYEAFIGPEGPATASLELGPFGSIPVLVLRLAF